MTSEIQYGLAAFNILLGLVAFFGGIVVKGVMNDLKELQKANLAFTERFGHFATRAEVKSDISEVREETRDALSDIARTQREGFKEVFDRLDAIRGEIGKKADRNEVRQ